MLYYTRFQSFKFCVVGLLAGVIIQTALISLIGRPAISLMRVASLLGSFAVIWLLCLIFVRSFSKSIASGRGKGTWSIIVAGLSFVIALVALSVVMDLRPTAWIRAMPGFWARLPEGNLFIVSGYETIYALLIAAFCIVAYKPLMVYMGFKLSGGKQVAKDRTEEHADSPRDDSWSLSDRIDAD